MPEATIVNLTTISSSFPLLESPQIHRDNILSTIEAVLTAQTDLLVVEGEDGLGKTTLLAQFAARHPENAISLFIRATSRWAYDPSILMMDLCNQLNWLLHEKEIDKQASINDGFLRSSFFALRRKAARKNNLYYLVIDGIDEIPTGEPQIVADILDMLPLGIQHFRCLISGNFEQLSAIITPRVRKKGFLLPGFTPDETAHYLRDVVPDPITTHQIHKLCRGIPGHLSSMKRILRGGTNLTAIPFDEGVHLRDLFDLEWGRLDSDKVLQLDVLAFIAFGSKPLSVTKLAEILECNSERIEEIVSGVSFLELKQGEVTYVSPAFRKFAQDRLVLRRPAVYSAIISFLLRQPQSGDSLEDLPDYYEQAGRLEELVQYLSPSNIFLILERAQSFDTARHQTNLGLRAARVLRRDGDLTRFSLQRSILLEGPGVGRSEVEAYMALNDYNAALTLANTTLAKEDRLELLCMIAKIKRQQGLTPETELIDQINQLLSQTKGPGLGDRATQIAADLLFVSPDLALDLMEHAQQTTSRDNGLDWALASLSATAVHAGDSRARGDKSVLNSITDVIKDPSAKKFSSRLSLKFANLSAFEVINETEKLEKVADRLTLLRQWVVDSRRRTDALTITEYALTLAVTTTSYTPNARLFHDLATPLPFTSDAAKRKTLIGIFDSQKANIRRSGPTEYYIKLELLLAHSESLHEFDAGSNRVLETYLEISELDVAIRVNCLAALMATLFEMDPTSVLEEREGLHSLVEVELREAINDLLRRSADHYKATRRMIRSLSPSNIDFAIGVVQQLNTENSRNRASLDIIETHIENELVLIQVDSISRIIKSISIGEVSSDAIISALARLDNEGALSATELERFMPWFRLMDDVEDAEERCQALCLAISILTKAGKEQFAGLISALVSKLDSAWRSIDLGWERVDTGFKISKALAVSTLELARRYLNETNEFRKGMKLDTFEATELFIASVRLSIRAFTGLLRSHIDEPHDIESLGQYIGKVPSSGERAQLWADLAVRCHFNQRHEECKKIVTERVRPLLPSISEDNSNYKSSVLIGLAPALYIAHKTTALEMVERLRYPYRDTALFYIVKTIANKKPPSEPFETRSRHYFELSYEELVDICELLKRLSYDVFIDLVVGLICQTIGHKRSRTSYSSEQRSDILKRIEDTLCVQLPDVRNIRHNGYQLAAKSYVLGATRAPSSQWNSIIESARGINNIPDRCLVLSVIAAELAARDKVMSSRLLKEAEELISEIPLLLERANKYRSIAQLVLPFDPGLGRQYLRSAMQSALLEDNPETFQIRLQIMDEAHSIDPDLASALASLVDDDPARLEIREQLQRSIRESDRRKALLEGKSSNGDNDEWEKYELAQSAWRALGAMNANRATALSLDRVRELVQKSSSYSISESFPIFAWCLESMVKKYQDTKQARSFLRPAFEATLSAVELTDKIVAKSSAIVKETSISAFENFSANSVMIMSSERDKGIAYLERWIEKNVVGYLKICDPYFGPADLEILQVILKINPDCKISILTSIKHQVQDNLAVPWDLSFRTYWRLSVSDQEPPDTKIVLAGTGKGGILPIHDRWWLTHGGGIRMGTSYNSLGRQRDSEISVLAEDEAKVREREIDQYFAMEKREHQGERLNYTIFNL